MAARKVLSGLFAFALALAGAIPAFAQGAGQTAIVVTTCGTPPATYTAGQVRQITQDINGQACQADSGGGSIIVNPGLRTIIPLDVSTVTTGGTAVTALNAGHRTAGGFLYNPIGATINLCINEQGTASGTTSSGALTCIQPGQTYTLVPAAGAVSVITSDSSHPFSGEGLN